MREVEVLDIKVVQKPTGLHWTLRIMEHPIEGGYKATLWECLDAANEAIERQFFDPLGKYYQQFVVAKQGEADHE